ncbi:relaxin-3-like [Arapaima gigas]
MDIKSLLSLMVLLLIAHQGTYGQDTRVKLCGRDFIRMVVTSCGSSRLKRFTPELNQQHGQSVREVLEWLDGGHFSYLRSSQSSENTEQQNQDRQFPARIKDITPSIENARATDVLKESHRLNRMLSRAQRDIGPAGVCCKSGCTINELVQYC